MRLRLMPIAGRDRGQRAALDLMSAQRRAAFVLAYVTR
jgi:hypothetical protein